jgi:hypothetical protein
MHSNHFISWQFYAELSTLAPVSVVLIDWCISSTRYTTDIRQLAPIWLWFIISSRSSHAHFISHSPTWTPAYSLIWFNCRASAYQPLWCSTVYHTRWPEPPKSPASHCTLTTAAATAVALGLRASKTEANYSFRASSRFHQLFRRLIVTFHFSLILRCFRLVLAYFDISARLLFLVIVHLALTSRITDIFPWPGIWNVVPRDVFSLMILGAHAFRAFRLFYCLRHGFDSHFWRTIDFALLPPHAPHS